MSIETNNTSRLWFIIFILIALLPYIHITPDEFLLVAEWLITQYRYTGSWYTMIMINSFVIENVSVISMNVSKWIWLVNINKFK